MSLRKITDADLQGKGVIGMPDTPNLSARAMQEKVEEIVRSVVIPVINENADNTVSNEKLADIMFTAGSGDMVTLKYDGDRDGVIDQADNGFFTYKHSKSGNTHYLTGSGDNIKFVSTADFAEGDVFMIDGSYCPAFLINGDALPDGFFKADFVVSCFRHGNCLNFSSGGAGEGLNFTVVGGTTQPASPKKNTIWVNTATPITGYTMSSHTNPSYTSSEGRVILSCVFSTYSDGGINALKTNNLYFKPEKAFQYIGGQWVKKELAFYNGDEWTGVEDVPAISFADDWAGALLTGTYGSVTIGNTIHMELHETKASVAAYTKEKINAGDISTIKIVVSSLNRTNNATLRVGLSNIQENANVFITNDWVVYETITAAGTYTVNVDGITGQYYLVAGLANSTGGDVTLDIAQISIE